MPDLTQNKVYDIFPLSILKGKIIINDQEKIELKNHILDTEINFNENKKKDYAWLGDNNGQEFLFHNLLFNKLTKLIGEKIKAYTSLLNINNEKLDFYFQRSWATITHTEEKIQLHDHAQSNISFAYYLSKPKNSGDIRFVVDSQNELAKGLFDQSKQQLGLLKSYDHRNASTVDIAVEEDDIIIFPSKTKHATFPNKTNEPRISISGDVSIILKDSYGHEKLMPSLKKWQIF